MVVMRPPELWSREPDGLLRAGRLRVLDEPSSPGLPVVVVVVVVGLKLELVEARLSAKVGPRVGLVLEAAAASRSPCWLGEQITGLHSDTQLVTTARKKTISEVGNLKASKGARTRWPVGSILTSGPMMFASVGQPSESMNWTEFALFAWNRDSTLFSLNGKLEPFPPGA